MIKTGDWTIAELIKYLVAVQTTLTDVEFERLKMTSAFLRERREGEKLPENGKLPRYKASDLYEPLDVFVSGGEWDEDAPEFLGRGEWWRRGEVGGGEVGEEGGGVGCEVCEGGGEGWGEEGGGYGWW